MNIQSSILYADCLPSVDQVAEIAREYGFDVAFEDGFSLAHNPSNSKGRIIVAINGSKSEMGYAVDPLELLIDDHELPPSLAEHGDVFVTVVTTQLNVAVGAAIELALARNAHAYGWQNENLVSPELLADGAQASLRHAGI